MSKGIISQIKANQCHKQSDLRSTAHLSLSASISIPQGSTGKLLTAAILCAEPKPAFTGFSGNCDQYRVPADCFSHPGGLHSMRAIPTQRMSVEHAVFWAPALPHSPYAFGTRLFKLLDEAQRGCITKTMRAQVGSNVDYFRKQEVYELFASCIADSLPRAPPELQLQPATVLVVPGSLGAGAASNGGIWLEGDLCETQPGYVHTLEDLPVVWPGEGAPGFLPRNMLLAVVL